MWTKYSSVQSNNLKHTESQTQQIKSLKNQKA